MPIFSVTGEEILIATAEVLYKRVLEVDQTDPHTIFHYALLNLQCL